MKPEVGRTHYPREPAGAGSGSLHCWALLVLLTRHSFSRAVRIATGSFYWFWEAEVWTSVKFKLGNSSCYLPLPLETSWWVSSLFCMLNFQGLEITHSLSSEFLSVSRCQHWNMLFPTTGCFLMLSLMIVFIFGVFFYGFEWAVLKEEGLTIWFWEHSASNSCGWFAHHPRLG